MRLLCIRAIATAALLPLLLGIGCNASTGPTIVRVGLAAEHRLLFVGNSLTYYNDLPYVVEALAAANGGSLHASSVTGGGFSLEDHWIAGVAADSIVTGHFNLVVLQQGPSALESSRVLLRDFARRFDVIAREHGARSALYAVWPSSDRAFDFDRVNESYALAAADVDGVLFPAGEAWRAAWRIAPGLRLWSSDGLHPTPAGTYLAALVVHARVFGQVPDSIPARLALANGNWMHVADADVAVLRQAATVVTATATAVRRSRDSR